MKDRHWVRFPKRQPLHVNKIIIISQFKKRNTLLIIFLEIILLLKKKTKYIFFKYFRYGDCWVRRAIPLAYALTSMSNPQLNTIDILVKSSHDLDQTTAVNAILALGLVGAGTNNARY